MVMTMTELVNIYLQICSKERYLHLWETLNNFKFPYALIKGEALSIQSYGKEGVRLSSDIDILLSRKVLPNFKNLLMENGFISAPLSRADNIFMLTCTHQIAPWTKDLQPWGSITVDINFDIFWGEYEGKRIDIEQFLADSIEMQIYGVKFKTLTPLKSMVQLVLHHYKEMNSLYILSRHNCINYNMFRDVYHLWKNNQVEISLDKLMDISLEYGIVPYTFYILYFTNTIFNDPDLEKYVLAFKTYEGECLLDYYGLTLKERKRWKVDFLTRLHSEDIYALIKNDLTESDYEKIKANQRILG